MPAPWATGHNTASAPAFARALSYSSGRGYQLHAHFLGKLLAPIQLQHPPRVLGRCAKRRIQRL
jgi:hypothetical protein